MAARIIFLRAVNVGGASLPMGELREIAEGLGASRVATYIASGNLICEPRDPETFDACLEEVIKQRYGFFREAISRSPEQVARALAEHPFDVVDPTRSYISFCRAAPEVADVEAARRYPTGDDRWEVIGEDLHIRYSQGAGRPEMPVPSILKALRVPTTARNLRTVRKVLELSG